MLDANYVHDKTGNPVIQLFGKTESGETKLLRVKKFRPYFYADVNYTNFDTLVQSINKLGYDTEVVNRFRPQGYQSSTIKMIKVYTKSPKDIKDARWKILGLPGVVNIYEADIPFVSRYLSDSGLFGMGWFEAGKNSIKHVEHETTPELRYMSMDIEVLPSETGFPTADKDPIIMISFSFSPAFNGLDNMVLTSSDIACARADVINCSSEYAMLKMFVDIVKEYDADIICGYNQCSFDIPYLNTRMDAVGIRPSIGRDSSKWFIREMEDHCDVLVAGRVVIDLLPIIRKMYSLKQYKLKNVSHELLKIEKLDLDPKDMREYWLAGGDKFKKFVSYSRRDAVVTLKLLLDLDIMPKYIALSKVSGALLSEVCNGGQSIMLNSLLLRGFNAENRVVAMRPPDTEESSFQGAYVSDPIPGLHEHVILTDMVSLYPSVIISNNICPSTVVIQETPHQIITDPNGGRFVHQDIKIGILPKILNDILQKRMQFKKLMKQEKDEKKKILYDALQYSYKILINSAYGVMGWSKSRFFNVTVASAVTAYGRETINLVRNTIDEDLKQVKANEKIINLKVILTDTDSAYVRLASESEIILDDADVVGNIVTSAVNSHMKPPMKLAYEGYARRALVLAKKRYCLWLIERDGATMKDRIKVKGIETVRRDWCNLTSKTLTECIETILKTGNVNSALLTAKKSIMRIRREDLKQLVDDIKLSKTYSKDASEYRNKQPHVQLIEKMKMRGMKIPMIGERVPFIIVKNGFKNISDRAEDPEYAIKSGIRIDTDYYIEKQLVGPLGRIFGVFGIEEKELTALGRQAGLTEWL